MNLQTATNLKHKGIAGVVSTLVENYKPDTPPFLVIL